jgi:hypothetical protein
MSTTDMKQEEPVVGGHQQTRNVSRRLSAIATILFLLLVSGGFFASRYQPIVVAGGFGIGHPEGAHQEGETQEFSLRNTGPIGVTVIALKRDVRHVGSTSQLRVAPVMICPIVTPHGGDCRQSRKTGLLEGTKFHPFGLTTGNNRSVLLRYRYPCVSSTVIGTLPTTLTLPVTYRFLWFTHTILLTDSADDTATCSPI